MGVLAELECFGGEVLPFLYHVFLDLSVMRCPECCNWKGERILPRPGILILIEQSEVAPQEALIDLPHALGEDELVHIPKPALRLEGQVVLEEPLGRPRAFLDGTIWRWEGREEGLQMVRTEQSRREL